MSKEAMKLALEALTYKEQGVVSGKKDLTNQAIKALEEALAKQEQGEPIQVTIKDFVKAVEGKEDLVGRPVYWAQWPNENTTPQQRTWVGLTAEEREQVQSECYGKVPHHVALIAAVEAKLKEKNG